MEHDIKKKGTRKSNNQHFEVMIKKIKLILKN